jgi:hypothetical protein
MATPKSTVGTEIIPYIFYRDVPAALDWLTRAFGFAEHMVLIHADGIEWRGQRYRSLSLVARKITGARWSGPRFFGLRQRQLDSTSTARTGHGQG